MDISKQTDLSLYKFIKEKSRELKIDEIGICSKDQYEKLEKNYNKNFLKVSEIFPECKVIISACITYNYRWNSIDSSSEGYIARFTTANFYKVLKKKLKVLADDIKKNYFADVYAKNLFKIYVNSKVNDKLCAYASGLGTYLKNNLIYINGRGVRFVLGEILFAREFDFIEEKKEIRNICSECSLCVNSCPTKALMPYKINKNICLQHLTTEEKWPDEINNRSIFDLWRKRFYGCTDCIDVCPSNVHINRDDPTQEFPGYININFDLTEILYLKKEDYKIRFQNNQLSSSWVREYLLARNALVSLYNCGKIDIIKKFLENINKYNWDIKEIEYLKYICFLLLNK
ncbi:MAG: epoxyqueuosine reductase [Spirochaetes bacterium]|nr:epoxyqueuosine reductase [Spirochaetota bacterium]